MKYIYLDNYRGFNNEFIPIRSVNFLVGENSTGKTSFLSSLKVLGSPRFWFRPSFDDPDLNFSSFSEIISKKSINKKYFTIGFYDSRSETNTGTEIEEKQPNLRLITFKNEEGIPAVYKYSFLSPIGLISTIISDASLRYKIQECNHTTVEELVRKCMDEHSESRPSDYKKFSKEGFPRQLFFANAYQFIVADMAGKDLLKNKSKITFEIEVAAPECRWIAPIRAKPEKIYSSQSSEYSSEGNHIPAILNRILGKANDIKDSKILHAINEFGKNSGLFDAVSIKRFGKEASAPFQLNVTLNGSELLVSNVGYGVSQVLPIILEARRRSSAEYISIQQPEVHLHPKAQASLGEFIYKSKELTGNNFVIETHSDYLIDRFRLCTNKNKCLNAQVLFFTRIDSGNKVHSIKINPDGSYSEQQPSQFREFFLNEELELMRL
ncbi:AAA family ATPase [Aeromonas caviae]|uniref:AAA family ATPase n=1 Tax=Aeromonas caviae TaxID=648 RepID=UPI002446AD43|nr:AAA family ATPase [Aeromonas caviae]MDH1840492.1 AAA family ATPase [Aeromonas caviae]